MRFNPVLCFCSLLLILSGAAQGQTPAKLVVASSPVVDSVSGLPEAPAAQPAMPLPEAPAVQPETRVQRGSSHPFFDRTNLQLHLGAVAAETADLITTREVLRAGGTERNPLARPLVHRGLGGQMLAIYGVGEGGSLLASYILHRTGHHRLERIVPIVAFVVEGLAAASNIRTSNKL